MSIEQNPLFRSAQVAFEEARYARRDAVARIDAEFTARAEQGAKASAEAAGRFDALEREVRERAEPAEEQPARWVPRANRQVVMSFGDEELRAEAAQAAPETTPIPVQAAPATVPIPVQAPEPVREPEPQRYLSFGGDEDEAREPEPRVERRPARQAPTAEADDDDLSGHSWMR